MSSAVAIDAEPAVETTPAVTSPSPAQVGFRAWAIVWVVVGALVLRAITQTTALVITHLADAGLGAGLHSRIAGWVLAGDRS